MPADFTYRYNTPLSETQEKQFQTWLAQNGRRGDLADYDLRGAWLNGASRADNGHFPDTYKKPNHPTFSDESIYSGKDGYVGGKWVDNGNGNWGYQPSETNLNFYSATQLYQYFRRVEPDSHLDWSQYKK